VSAGPGGPAHGAELVLGTTNAGKVRELAVLLEPHGIRVVSLRDCGGGTTIEETGATFAENASLKAAGQAAVLGRWVLAEDSGLCVAALEGAPGVRSARFSGTGDDEANNDLLLERMAGVPDGSRGAWYACHAALADPGGRVVAVSEGVCRGMIARSRSGSGGFGYDPLFVVPEYHRTFGELPAEVKSLLSHRARAMRAMLPAVLRHLDA